MTRNRIILLHVLFSISIHFTSCALQKNRIEIDGNGYLGVTIAISRQLSVTDRVTEDAYLDRLKEIFTAASRQLYKSTRRRLYFKEITIVVPPNWTTRPEHGVISGPQFDMAHIILDNPNELVGSRPYVNGMSECGKAAMYMHLAPYTVLREVINGSLDKAIVHEWGHLRWGLFDEYPESEVPMLSEISAFITEGGKNIPNVCSSEVRGEFKLDCREPDTTCQMIDGSLDRRCKFCPHDQNTAKSSIMGYHFLSSIEEFCDDNSNNVDVSLRHNTRVDTRQNRFCDRRSAWAVMREHSDFLNTTEGSSSQTTIPTFNIVQQGEQRFALVMDISGSMRTDGRLDKLREASAEFLLNIVDDESYVSLVTFSSTASIVQPLTKITSVTVRETLVDKLPTKANGATAIGAGLEKGLESLQEGGKNVSGSRIILVTDGKETANPFIKDVRATIVASGVIITSLAFTNQSDVKLVALAADTGGRSFLYTGNDNSTALVDAFTQSSIESSDSENTLVQIESRIITVSTNNPYSGSFVIDSTIGKDTGVSLSGSNISSISVTVRSPNMTEYLSPSSCFQTCQVRILGIIQEGNYQISVTSTSNESISLSYSILSRPRTPNSAVIKVNSWMNSETYNFEATTTQNVYASVSRGLAPVLGVDVVAVVESSSGITESFAMRDNGAGADIYSGDGVYTVGITRRSFTSSGRYNVKVKVKADSGNARVMVPATRRKRQTQSTQGISYNTAAMENFQRTSLGGEFNVINFNASLLATDTIPPSSIKSLTLVSVNKQTANFTLRWTAVGDDFDFGTATSYDIRLSTDFDQLIADTDSGQLVSTIGVVPKTPGELEYFSVVVSNSTVTYYVAVRAVDESGNIGDISNIISLSFIPDPTPTGPVKRQPREDNTPIIPITVAILVSIFIFVGILVVLYLIRRHTKLRHKEKRRRSRRTQKPYSFFHYFV